MTTEEQISLIQQAKDASQFLERNEKDNDKFGNSFAYVISTKWLREWKLYTSYDRIIKGELPDEVWLGKNHPGKINKDIVINKDHFMRYPETDDYRNVVVREDADYDLITEGAWKYFAARYEHITIKRPVHILPDGKKEVEVVLKQVWVVPMNNYQLRQIDHKRAKELKVYSVQTSSHTKFQDFKIDIVTILNAASNKHLLASNLYHNYYTETVDTIVEGSLNIWLLDPALDLRSFFGEISETCRRSSSYDYQIEFKGQYLEKEPSQKLSELSAPEDILFIDIRESSKGWAFFGDGAPVLKKCEYCYQFEALNFQCSCKEVAYCSETCQEKDKRFHQIKCKTIKIQEEEQKNLPIFFPGFEDF